MRKILLKIFFLINKETQNFISVNLFDAHLLSRLMQNMKMLLHKKGNIF